MTQKEFEEVLAAQWQRCSETLNAKAAEYAADSDRLHNFKVAAAARGCTPVQALSGMLVKHTVSVYDMMESDKRYSVSLWDEKITDHINYLLLLKALLVEEQVEETKVQCLEN